jgi:hypothetical protein
VSARKPRRRPKVTVVDTPSLAQRLDAERRKVFAAMAVIDVTRVACHSAGLDAELAGLALQAAYDIFDETAGELEAIRDAYNGARTARPEVRS